MIERRVSRSACQGSVAESLAPFMMFAGYKVDLLREYCTKTINSLGGVTVTMPNEILVSLTGPGTCDTPQKNFVNVTKYLEKKFTKNRRKFDYF